MSFWHQLALLPGFPSNFTACREINCQVIDCKGRFLICILISELKNEIAIFLPWTDRRKSHCLQFLNTPHQIYRYWYHRERDHFLCHHNLKCKQKNTVSFSLARYTIQGDCFFKHTQHHNLLDEIIQSGYSVLPCFHFSSTLFVLTLHTSTLFFLLSRLQCLKSYQVTGVLYVLWLFQHIPMQ